MAKLKSPAKQIAAAVKAARKQPTPLATHALRVGLARLRVWLRLADHPALDEDVRWLRRAVQPSRDLDVQLELEPPPAVAQKLEATRPAVRQELARALADPRTTALLEALRQLEPLERSAAKRGVRLLARRARKAIRAAEDGPDALETLHALRRRVRDLRYALEALGKSADKELALQTALGDFCDRAVALQSGAEGEWARRLEREQGRAKKKAKKRWRVLKPRLKRWA